VGSLGVGSGGSFTVTGSPVVVSVSGLAPCNHYRLAMSGPGGSKWVCGVSGLVLDVSDRVQIGDSVSVTLEAPPNACPP